MFDVNTPETMHALKKWWADFCDRAPLADGDAHDYCCVVVGNKIDTAGRGRGLVSASEALEFVDELVPGQAGERETTIQVLPPEVSNGSPEIAQHIPPAVLAAAARPDNVPSPSIAIHPKFPPYHHPSTSSSSSSPAGHEPGASPSASPKHQLFKSRSRSSSRFYAGTMTTTHTTLTIYHTPSSSVFDVYQSARASPEPGPAPDPPPGASPGLAPRQRTLTMLSTGSASSGSAPTITPSLIAREREAAAQGAAGASPVGVSPTSGPPSASAGGSSTTGASALPPRPPERGPRLFFTSAKTGEGVADVFEYVARRVVQKWAYDEWVEARTMHFREASASAAAGGAGGSATVRLLQGQGGRWGERKRVGDCCAS